MPRSVRVILLYSLMGLALVNALEISALRDALAGYSFAVNSPIAAGMTWLAIVAGCVFLDSLIGRRYVGGLVLGLLLVVITFASAEKQKYLSEPLFPWDFLFANQIVDLIPQFVKEQPFRTALIILSLALAIIGIVSFARVLKGRLPRISILGRAAGMVLGLIVLVPFGYGAQREGQKAFRSYLGLLNNPNLQAKNYRNNGFLIAFLLNADSTFVSKPVDYSAEKIRSIASQYDTGNAAAAPSSFRSQQPNVVMIMSEAFWDPTQFPGVTFDKDPLPFVHATSTGDIFSPAFGGGTSNVEFEALTGFSNAFLPEGSFPYQQYVLRNIPALPWYFQSIGYRTRALHPYQKWFWNRDKAYPHLGFQKFISIADIDTPRKAGPYVSDDQLTDLMLDQLKSDQPTFLFTVTMQNHTPFAPKRYGTNQIMPKGNLSEDEAQVLSSYAQGISYSDQALQRFTERLKTLDRPTLVIFFGDHGPGLGNQSIYLSTGLRDEQKYPGAMGLMRFRRTPLMVWSSETGRSEPIGTISPSMLPLVVMQQLGLQHPFYRNFLGSVRDKVRVYDRGATLTSDGQLSDAAPARFDPLLKQYFNIQYDQMFGPQYAQPQMFCEMTDSKCRSPASVMAMPQPPQ